MLLSRPDRTVEAVTVCLYDSQEFSTLADERLQTPGCHKSPDSECWRAERSGEPCPKYGLPTFGP